jgi:hypothetical protein
MSNKKRSGALPERTALSLAVAAMFALPAMNASAAGGDPIGAEIHVNSTTNSQQANAAMAMDADGDHVIVWQSLYQDGTGPLAGLYGVYGQRFDNTGAPVGGEFLINTATSNDQMNPAVAMDTDGDFVVVWQSRGQDGQFSCEPYGYICYPSNSVYGQRFDNTGAKVGAEFRVNTTVAGEQTDPDVSMNDNGDFVVTWQSDEDGGTGYYGHLGIYAQRYDNAGTAINGQVAVNTTVNDEQSLPRVALDNSGQYTVVWQSAFQDGFSYGIVARRFDVKDIGGAEFVVNTITSDIERHPDVAVDGTGNFVVAWDNYSGDVRFQRYSAAGFVQGSETIATGAGIGGSNPAIGRASNGAFAIAWDGFGDTSDLDGGVYVQRFDATGNALGAPARANTERDDRQQGAAVAMDDTGDFVVAWESYGQEGGCGCAGIFAQRFLDTADPFGFPNRTGVTPHAYVHSADYVVVGLGTGVPISVAGNHAAYSINGTAYTGGPGLISDGDRVRVRVVSGDFPLDVAVAQLTIGATSDWFVATSGEDFTPAAFSFTDLGPVASHTYQFSNTIRPAGFNVPVVLNLTGDASAMYSVNGGAFSTGFTILVPGDRVRLRLTSSDAGNTTASATLDLNGVSDSFDVTTDVDTDPASFDFVDQAGVLAHKYIYSETLHLNGFNTATTVNVSGDPALMYSINSAPFTNAANGTLNPGDRLRLRIISPRLAGGSTGGTVTVGTTSDAWQVTTAP